MARSIIVTGGFGVLGQAVAEAFAAQGDKVARVDFAASPAVPLAGSLDIGGVNLTDSEATAAAIRPKIARVAMSITAQIRAFMAFLKATNRY